MNSTISTQDQRRVDYVLMQTLAGYNESHPNEMLEFNAVDVFDIPAPDAMTSSQVASRLNTITYLANEALQKEHLGVELQAGDVKALFRNRLSSYIVPIPKANLEQIRALYRRCGTLNPGLEVAEAVARVRMAKFRSQGQSPDFKFLSPLEIERVSRIEDLVSTCNGESLSPSESGTNPENERGSEIRRRGRVKKWTKEQRLGDSLIFVNGRVQERGLVDRGHVMGASAHTGQLSTSNQIVPASSPSAAFLGLAPDSDYFDDNEHYPYAGSESKGHLNGFYVPEETSDDESSNHYIPPYYSWTDALQELGVKPLYED